MPERQVQVIGQWAICRIMPENSEWLQVGYYTLLDSLLREVCYKSKMYTGVPSKDVKNETHADVYGVENGKTLGWR